MDDLDAIDLIDKEKENVIKTIDVGNNTNEDGSIKKDDIIIEQIITDDIKDYINEQLKHNKLTNIVISIYNETVFLFIKRFTFDIYSETPTPKYFKQMQFASNSDEYNYILTGIYDLKNNTFYNLSFYYTGYSHFDISKYDESNIIVKWLKLGYIPQPVSVPNEPDIPDKTNKPNKPNIISKFMNTMSLKKKPNPNKVVPINDFDSVLSGGRTRKNRRRKPTRKNKRRRIAHRRKTNRRR